MMFTLGIYYISVHQTLLGLFQIFIYTGGVVVLLLFGLTVIGIEFPPHQPRVLGAVVALFIFVVMSFFFMSGVSNISFEGVSRAKELHLFGKGYYEFVILFALVGVSLIYATVKMASMLKLREGREDDGV
jgi:NADH-quinone oxidoreductase subunit J